MLRARPRRLRSWSFNRLIPNILTLLALCAGLTAVRFALEQNFKLAVIAIMAAAVMDGLDGRIARLIGATSRFGAELDSLSDFVCFGVVPALVLYLWTMHDGGRIGWAVVLLFAICTSLRLARFNTALDDDTRPSWTYNYFTGVPAPAGAGLVLLPLIASFEAGPGALHRPWVVGLWIGLVAFLMVSRIPTFALKRLRIPSRLVMPTLIAVCAVAAGLVTEPWWTMVVCGLCYLAAIPMAVRAVRQHKRDDALAAEAAAAAPVSASSGTPA